MDNVILRKSNISDISLIHKMQIEAFMPLLNIYHDYNISPASETIEQIQQRFEQPFTTYFVIYVSETPVGAIRIIDKGNNCYRISPIFIIPEYQGKGIAQKVFIAIEKIYCNAIMWELDTILQEKGNCYLYEKLGYVRTEKEQKISDEMTIVYYQKSIVK